MSDAEAATPEEELRAALRHAGRESALLAGQVELAHDALVVVTPEGRIERWNAAAERLLRLPREAAEGEHLSSVLPDVGPRQLVPGPARATALRGDGLAVLLEVRGASVEHQGDVRFLLVLRDARAALSDEAPVPAGDDGTGGLDAEALRTLAAEKHQRSAILSATSDGMLLLDPGGVVAYANRRFGELVGVVDVDGLEGQTAGALAQGLRERGPEPPQAFDRVLLAADRRREVLPSRCVLNGRTLRLAMSPVRRDEGFLGSLVVVRDVTLEEKVQRAKEELIGNVSHELRTPLTSIRGFVDLMRSGRAGPVTAKQKEFLDIVADNVSRLTLLVADLLEVDRVGQAPLAAVRVDLSPLLRDALAMEEVNARRKTLDLALLVPDELEVLGDSDRLRQVFGNLMSNAVKYTPRGYVAVRARVEGERVRVDIQDTGIGIRPEDRAQLFQRFFRADDPQVRAAGGTGLGLSIVHTLVQRQGGTIEVESEPGHGSCFRVFLPAAPPRTRAPVERAAPPAPAPPPPRERPRRGDAWPRVLAIDPDPARQRFYEIVLRGAGLEPIPAPHWARAQEVAQEGPPDLVLVASCTPGLPEGGWRALLDEPRIGRAPVVVVITPDEVGGAVRAGVAGLVTQPLEAPALRAEVERVLALRRAAPGSS